MYSPKQIKPKAKKHFNHLSNLYLKKQKKGASIDDLWKSLNHLNKLSNPNQLGKIKVIYPKSGSFIKAAVIKDETVLIDDSLYYANVESLDEAYFICAIYNSKVVSDDLKLRGSTGFQGKTKGFDKRPLDYVLPKYNPKNNLHKVLADLGRFFEEKVDNFVDKWLDNEWNKIKEKVKCIYCKILYTEGYIETHKSSCKVKKDRNWTDADFIETKKSDVKIKPKTIQNRILEKFGPYFEKYIDPLVKKLFGIDIEIDLEQFTPENVKID